MIKTLDPSQENALELLTSGMNVFLTGNAGTGKTTVITEFLKNAVDPIAITATTGIAALNMRDHIKANTGEDVDAMTIYRWSGIGIGPYNNAYQGYETNEKCWARLMDEMRRPPHKFSRAKAIDRICDAKTLIIDEISMLPGKALTFLDYFFRRVRNQHVPFGGIQMVLVGDFLQLPPVSKTGKYDWCFMTKAWQEADFTPAVLTRIHRQDDDEFKGLLNAVRVGRISESHAASLKKRVARFPSEKLIRLYTHNVQVDKFNTMRLNMIEEPSVTVEMRDSGHPGCTWVRENLVCPELLELKVGARVMVTVNLSDNVVNGSLGTIVRLGEKGGRPAAEVALDSGDVVEIETYVWNVVPGSPEKGFVSQLPLRLAWATTIHKSQGLSLDSALIDARAAREPGQAYVALSRVRTMRGLFLKDTFSGVFVSPDAINFTDTISQHAC